ncbi:MAG: hypothetical protein K8T25_06470 [Planctomycetia bacterium]|nr:hypothetical protein [Planctomycetia bacterium]
MDNLTDAPLADPPVPLAEQPAAPRLAHVPRLGIRHLLLWTALTALFLAVTTNGLNNSPPARPPDRQRWITVVSAIQALLGGASLTGCVLIGWHAIRRTLWPLEPGERLLLAFGLTYLMMVAFQWLCPRPLMSGMSVALAAYILTPVSCGAVIFATQAVLGRRQPWWAAVLWIGVAERCVYAATFLVFALNVFAFVEQRSLMGSLMRIGAIVLRYLFSIEATCIALALVAAIVVDARRGRKHRWLHWLGAAVLGGDALFRLGATVYSWRL